MSRMDCTRTRNMGVVGRRNGSTAALRHTQVCRTRVELFRTLHVCAGVLHWPRDVEARGRHSPARGKRSTTPMRVGIDASNLRSGGSLTHIGELLTAAQPEKYGVTRVV